MNTPLSSRMSSWDIPHVPPTLPTAPDAAPPAQAASSAGESNTASQEPLGPMSRPGESALANPDSSAAQVRFLNAVVDDGAPLRVLSGNRLLSSSLSSGALSEYFIVAAGFRTFSFYDAQHNWMLLFRSTIPLAAGDVVTLAVIRSGGGLDVVRVDDRPCGVRGSDRSCMRCVNLIHNSPGLDLILTDGRVVFTDMRFKEVTNYRRARPGRYDLYVAQTPYALPAAFSGIETVEELPMVVSNYFLPGFGSVEPLSSFFLELRAGIQASVYLLGNWDHSRQIDVRMAENY